MGEKCCFITYPSIYLYLYALARTYTHTHTHTKVTLYVSIRINASLYCSFYQENCNMLRRNTFWREIKCIHLYVFGPRTSRATLNLNILFTCAAKNKAEGTESNFVSRSQLSYNGMGPRAWYSSEALLQSQKIANVWWLRIQIWPYKYVLKHIFC